MKATFYPLFDPDTRVQSTIVDVRTRAYRPLLTIQGYISFSILDGKSSHPASYDFALNLAPADYLTKIFEHAVIFGAVGTYTGLTLSHWDPARFELIAVPAENGSPSLQDIETVSRDKHDLANDILIGGLTGESGMIYRLWLHPLVPKTQGDPA